MSCLHFFVYYDFVRGFSFCRCGQHLQTDIDAAQRPQVIRERIPDVSDEAPQLNQAMAAVQQMRDDIAKQQTEVDQRLKGTKYEHL